MKKLFSIFFALAMLLPVNVKAQDNFAWSNAYNTWNYFLSNSNARRLDGYQWGSGSYYVKLIFFHQKANAVTYTTPNGKTWTFPNKGTYTISNTVSSSDVMTGYGTQVNGNYRESYITYDGSNAYWPYYNNGTKMYIEEGADGPYIRIPNNVSFCDGSYTYDQDGIFVGSSATYYSVNVNTESATKGTVSYSMKSGYVYTNNITNWKKNSVYTLTATPKTGYRFVCWKKGSTQISTNAVTDVTITGNATYTAYFEANAYTPSAGTITAVPNNASYGSVTGTAGAATFVSGTNYAGGTTITLNATPNAGYYFNGWSDSNSDNPRVFNVDGAKNITANFVAKTNYTRSYSWSTDVGVVGVNDWNSASGMANSSYILFQYQLFPNFSGAVTYPAASFSFCIDYSEGYATYDAGFDGPFPGEYPVNTTATTLSSSYKNKLLCNPNYVNMNNGQASPATKSFYWTAAGAANKLTFESGSVVIEYGRHGYPYLYSKNLENSTSTFNLTVGPSRNMTTTYTSVTVAKADDYNKVVLYANDGSNSLNLIFNVASIDANVYIPAGTYTVGTNVWGSLHDDDGYSDWKLIGGTITISNSGSALSMTTTALTSISEDDNHAHNLNLTISGRTPTKKTITNIAVGSATVNKEDGYFNVIGSKSPYDVRVESASVDYRTGYFAHYELERTNEYTYLKQNNSHITLDYNKQLALVSEVGSYIFTEAYLCSTSGTIYRIAAFNGAYTITYKDQSNVAYTGSNAGALPTSHIYGSTTTLVDGVKAGATFNGWYENAACTGSPITSIGATAKIASFTLYAKWTPLTYTVTVAKNNNDYGTLTNESENVRVINNVPYGSTFTVDGSTITINGTTVTATPAANDAQYSYAFSGWTNGAATVTGNMTVTANFTRTVNTYDITFKNADGTTLKKLDGTTDAVYSVAYGETPVYDGATPTKTADDAYTYTFNGWDNEIVAVTAAATYTATYNSTKVQYALAWNMDGGTTTSVEGDYTSGTIDWGTPITAPADPTKTNYTFTGWKSNISGEVETPSVMPKQALTYTAQWESSVTPEIVLNEEGGQHTLGDVATNKTLDDLADEYNNRDVNVTIDRTLYGGSWNTIVFPFSVEDMEGNVLDGSLYELNTSTTTATSEGMVINFEPLSGDGKIVAGKPYLIRTSAEVNLNSYPFNGVRLTAEFSSVTDGDAVDFVPIKEKEKINYDAENLAIFIVGNRLYYPNKTTGTNLRGFRAYLRIKNGTYYGGPVRIRIADTGETITLDEEQEIETRKYVEDGILIIERGGVRYDAQGKRME